MSQTVLFTLSRLLPLGMLLVTSGCEWYPSGEPEDQAEPSAETTPDSFGIMDRFVPTLWGDASQISISPAYSGVERPGDDDGNCIRVSYLPGEKHWGAIYWQTPREAGIRKPLEIAAATRLSFWAKGEAGGEKLDFRALGDPARELLSNHDRFELTPQWQRFDLSLQDVPPKGVTALFGIKWQSTREENPSGLVFYLDDLRCE